MWITRESHPGLFAATAGGMGLTGLISAVELRLTRTSSDRMLVDTERVPDLDGLLAAMDIGADPYPYSVAWVDLLATGASLGRGVLTRGRHAPSDFGFAGRSPGPRRVAELPPCVPSGLLNVVTARVMNLFWYGKAPARRREAPSSIDSFFFPLDAVGGWNRAYGRTGLIQYQFVLPHGEEETLRAIIGELASLRIPVFLAVLKRLGTGGELLSFPRPGWTLALDIPARRVDVVPVLSMLDRMVVDAGGRHYLAKDARMSPDTLFAGYGSAIAEWRRQVEDVAPNGQWQSDLARRLRLLE